MMQREERHTFDQRGGDDHGGLDVPRDLGLPGHALDGRLGQHADAHGRTEDHQAGADRLEVRERRGAGLGLAHLAVGDEEERPGQHDRLDQLHLNLDSLHLEDNYGERCGESTVPRQPDGTTMASPLLTIIGRPDRVVRPAVLARSTRPPDRIGDDLL